MNDRLSTPTGLCPPRGRPRRTDHAGRRQRQRGCSVVEFALLTPLLIVITFGAIELSIALYDKSVITHASGEAALAGVVYMSPPLTNTQIQTIATTYCSNYLISLGGTIAPTVTVSHPSGTTSGKSLTVTVSYGYQGPRIGALIDPISKLLSMSATTTINDE